MNVIEREICRDKDRAPAHEWLVHNGRGSYAAGSITGALTRSQHGLLVACTDAASSSVTLAKVDEEVDVDGRVYKLGTNEYAGAVVEPDGYLFLQQVQCDGIVAKFFFEAGLFQLTKSVWMEPAQLTTFVQYELARSSAPIALTLVPMCDYRPADQVTQGSEQWRFQITRQENGIEITAREDAKPYRIFVVPTATFTPLDLWYWRFQLRAADNARTDLFVPGLFRINLEPGDALTLIATMEPQLDTDFATARARAYARVAQTAFRLPCSNEFTSDTFRAILPRGDESAFPVPTP